MNEKEKGMEEELERLQKALELQTDRANVKGSFISMLIKTIAGSSGTSHEYYGC